MRVAIVSTYPPRVCGIGAFAADLHGALLGVEGVDVEKVVIVNEPSRPQRPGLVATVNQAVRGDYVRAARTLGRLDVDVVLLQHEYGIFGGRDGEYVLSLVKELGQPLVVTLHTVLSEPSPHQAEILASICREAGLVIVMTETAERLLVESGGADAEKVRIVPHGAPTMLARRADEYAEAKAQGSERGRYPGRFLLSTFGLISEGKGLELAIRALPEVIERHPEALYLIAGSTHPDVSRREGERYRLSLERLVSDLGLEECVEFDDRFMTVDQIADLLAETDVFVTPYRSKEQISSGALTFGLAAGCAVISTPYWCAQDLLASGAGVLVPFNDSEALADAVLRYADEPERFAAARAAARGVGKHLTWPAVAKQTKAVLAEAIGLEPRRRTTPVALPVSVRTDHLLSLVDDVGIIQHAHGVIPNRNSGYCVDDVARLAVVAFELSHRGDEQVWMPIVYRSLSFLHNATDHRLGMRNFMGYDRSWLDEPHHGDHVGRTIWALGEILSMAWVPAAVRPTRRLLDDLVGSFSIETSLRSWAYAVLGLTCLDPDRLDESSGLLLENLVDRLEQAYTASASDGWPWFEDTLSYDNARLPQALVAGGLALERPDLVDIGLHSLCWFGDQCGLDRGMLQLIGRNGRHRDEQRDPKREYPNENSDDEQPLDASALVEAELAAFAVSGDPEHRQRAQLAFDWFLGRNRLEIPLYDFATGGCSDGLGATAANDNEGAESTLAFHRAALLLDSALPTRLRRRALEGVS